MKQLTKYINKNNIKKKDLYIYNDNEIKNSNFEMAEAILFINAVLFAVLFVLSLFLKGYYYLSGSYFIMLIISLIYLFLYKKAALKINISIIIYSYFCLSFFFSAFTGCVIYTKNISIIMFIFLFQLQLLIVDKERCINSVSIISGIVYMLFALFFKSKEVKFDEVVNTCVVLLISIYIGRYVRNTKLLNFELNRVAIVREYTDFLTGINNRRKMFVDIAKSEASESQNKITGVFMIDIDKFKNFNDTYGHKAGDECLTKVSQCFKEFAAKNSLYFYRFGGEEFTAFSYNHSEEELFRLAEKLNAEIIKLNIPNKNYDGGIVTVSIGVAYSQKGECINPELLISRADMALYLAKSNGRNRAELYSQELEDNDYFIEMRKDLFRKRY